MSRAEFQRIWRYHGILWFLFYFVFRTTGKRTTKRKQLQSLLGFFLWESTILKLLYQARFKVFSQQLQDTSTTAFEAIYYSWRFYGHGSPYELFFSWKISLNKNRPRRWKIIVCTIFRACSSKSIASRFEEHCTKTFHLLLYASSSSLK